MALFRPADISRIEVMPQGQRELDHDMTGQGRRRESPWWSQFERWLLRRRRGGEAPADQAPPPAATPAKPAKPAKPDKAPKADKVKTK